MVFVDWKLWELTLVSSISRLGLWLMFAVNLLSVEVAPIYDNPGETTVLAAAEVVHALIGLMVYIPDNPSPL